MVAKQSCSAHPKNERKYNPETGEFVLMDLCGGFETRLFSSALYFVLFKDNATGFRTVYIILIVQVGDAEDGEELRATS